MSYYQKLYTKPPDEPDDLSGCIENFLSPSILSHPVIRDSILTLAEKTKLESNLTLFELDEAVKKANKKSAAGIDGLSGTFISKFWSILRKPLLRYAAHFLALKFIQNYLTRIKLQINDYH